MKDIRPYPGRPCRGEYPSNNERQGVSSGRSSEETSVMDVERRTKQIQGY